MLTLKPTRLEVASTLTCSDPMNEVKQLQFIQLHLSLVPLSDPSQVASLFNMNPGDGASILFLLPVPPYNSSGSSYFVKHTPQFSSNGSAKSYEKALKIQIYTLSMIASPS